TIILKLKSSGQGRPLLDSSLGSGIARYGRNYWVQNRRLGLSLRHISPSWRRLVVVERQSGDQSSNLNRVQRLALQQSFGQSHQRVLVLNDDLTRAVVLLCYQAIHLLINLDRGVFTVVLMLRDLAAKEDLLLLLAVGDRPKARHSKLTYHLARKLGRFFDVVCSASGHVIQKHFFGDPSAHHYRDLAFEIVAGVRIAIGLG